MMSTCQFLTRRLWLALLLAPSLVLASEGPASHLGNAIVSAASNEQRLDEEPDSMSAQTGPRPFLSIQRDSEIPDTLKRVEIIRGPASTLSGSDRFKSGVGYDAPEGRLGGELVWTLPDATSPIDKAPSPSSSSGQSMAYWI